MLHYVYSKLQNYSLGGKQMQEIEVQYLKDEMLTLPTQGYEDDFAIDIYTAEGRLVPPLTFKSVIIPTNLKAAFDPQEAGMRLALRSGVAANSPLVMPNATAIIEGTYRGNIGIIVRNTFIDNRPVDFVLDTKGNQIPLQEVPSNVKKMARLFFMEELERLGYKPKENKVFKDMFKTVVPCGTVYVKQQERIAQMYFSPKITPKFIPVDELPESNRGENGYGSSGTELKKENNNEAK
jgi:dUTPase